MAAAVLPAPKVWAMAPAGSEGVVHRAKGVVRVNGTAVGEGAKVRAGDTVATEAEAEAVFSLGDDGFLLRSQGAVSVLDRGTDTATGKPVREVNLEEGRVLSVFGPKQITLKTPFANVGIRGTAAYLECGRDSMNICVCYGRAVMIPTDAPQRAEEVVTRHHDAPRLIRPGVMEPYMVKNHADDELVMLEALFGRVPPFLR
ncbi:FecR family protein [Paramagnetospirillum marisnigri]|uniref:FecR domain-containing protein n=1 Tax=Paramagnetospirillum marisnigri TaxID=1285242 RepID=UPI001FE21D9A|nr:FecR domain-containing protein [Paramagnetospirillum marisnigri]